MIERLTHEKRRLERDIDHLRQHDPLTGLLNRQSFITVLDRFFTTRDAKKSKGVLIEIGFKGMPRINGALGRHAADYVLSALAARLNMQQAVPNIFGRIDYWSFAAFYPDISDALEALSKGKELIELLSEPVDWVDRGLTLDVCAGVAICDPACENSANLIEHANLAMKSAGERGGRGYSFFNPALAKAAQRRSDLITMLQQGFKNDDFKLQYQPLFDLKTGELSSFEALMRLDHPQFGIISPAEFIPVAEETGMIAKLGAWALTEACRAASHWPSHLTVAVNISPEQFYTGTLITDVHHALELSSFPAYRLELEVTESTMLKDSDIVLQQLNSLRDMGCAIVLDDFGTGYSSLSYLWKFPFSKLKIDRSFIQAMDSTPMVRGMLRSIIDLARNFGLKTTAEGIETVEQADTIREFGADTVQGYLTGKPMDEKDMPALILRKFSDKMRNIGQAAPREDRRIAV